MQEASNKPSRLGSSRVWWFCFPVFIVLTCGSNLLRSTEILRDAQAQTRLKAIALGIGLYSQDNDDKFPLVGNWNRAVIKYAPPTSPSKLLRDPFLASETEDRGFGMNSLLSSAKCVKDIDAIQGIVIAQTTLPGENAIVTRDTIRCGKGARDTLWAVTTELTPRKLEGRIVQGLLSARPQRLRMPSDIQGHADQL